MHATCAEIQFVVIYLSENFILKSSARKVLLIMHQGLTCAGADNAMQPKETSKNSRSWYPITLAQSTRGLGKLVYSEFV